MAVTRIWFSMSILSLFLVRTTRSTNWELGEEQNFKDMMEHVIIKYNNMVKQNQWKRADSNDATILVSTMLYQKLEKEKRSAPMGQHFGDSFYTDAVKEYTNCKPEVIAAVFTKFTLEPWRIINEDPAKIDRILYTFGSSPFC